jgi:hypothetical protein
MFARRWAMKEVSVHGNPGGPAPGSLPVAGGCALAQKAGGCGGACSKARAKREAKAAGGTPATTGGVDTMLTELEIKAVPTAAPKPSESVVAPVAATAAGDAVSGSAPVENTAAAPAAENTPVAPGDAAGKSSEAAK